MKNRRGNVVVPMGAEHSRSKSPSVRPVLSRRAALPSRTRLSVAPQFASVARRAHCCLLLACSACLVAVTTIVSGCRIHPGTNHLLLVTRSNSGFDADTVPTVIELSLFGRFDGVHAPSFEDAQTPPVVTSFQRERGFWAPTGAIFAAGPAALAIASYAPDARGRTDADPLGVLEKRYNELSEIELSQPPQFDNPSKRLFAAGEAPPMWFATAESLGFELEFFGPSFPPLLQSVHVGYRRKEFLATPLSISEEQGRNRPFIVRTPSVLALVNVFDVGDAESVEKKEKAEAELPAGDSARGAPKARKDGARTRRDKRVAQRVQLFATGRAATRLAADPRVRKLFLRPLVGEQEHDCQRSAESSAEEPNED